MNIENKEMLYTLSKEDLATELTPYYQDFYDQLSDHQKENISFDMVVNDAYKRLHFNNSEPTDTDGRLKLIEYAGESPCIHAIGIVVADAFKLAFKFMGIHKPERESATQILLKKLGHDAIHELLTIVHNLKNSNSITDKSKHTWSLISAVESILGISGITDCLKETMHWYNWMITGITAIAQLTIWFATGGAAFIAEIALAGPAIARLALDSVDAANTCS
ncbi:hypothetical protein GPY51_13940 [Photorhabdus laumondii subsp. laumondii]|uniref:Photorhabdus luminescens subsp. laumondii TTO1 complete genome segment 4/17 n=2 Tax=Photorhabdus laumondii subsp. laumondii TaxID=141679 RepID=Q7N7H4_PHOLL|nr:MULTISPECIES: hypothetical protein [Photorhabdus]AWK41065.1 hypothetical protein A4R40_05805 [Photorhabdus laumondii subsp. laumondii]AXG41805.1 hypothetical protein PluDJC_05595 [Photorhabdus laumondii subsp. laumondii]AXG46393.1 hypothetical protein PluTT01m_05990 [Photorhabdus laumondii subsp. laumondii]KTL62423.1 hypothetical protein AA106_06220 [Photorhabdus laumondii subsp. laumondii]MCC8386621.1 hypothetical protein [Photorhabdus laumondii]